MGTLVSFHAHPDDEAIACGGTMAEAAARGHRVVLVSATRGEHGEVPAGLLRPGESLAERRTAETAEAARILGVSRVEFLGYRDSGMLGTPENDAPGCFWRADVEEAAGRLAAILVQEEAEALTIYDDHGGYGHPDHVQVHRVGHRAAELAGTRLVLEATVDRTALIRALSLVSWTGLLPADFAPQRLRQSYSDRAAITHRIDVRRFASAKRRSMAAHASQAGGGAGPRTLALFLRLPGPLYRRVFGAEWFIEAGRRPARPAVADLFASLR
jgi:LmbE family N-acetylglucosaminyl deacetylase